MSEIDIIHILPGIAFWGLASALVFKLLENSCEDGIKKGNEMTQVYLNGLPYDLGSTSQNEVNLHEIAGDESGEKCICISGKIVPSSESHAVLTCIEYLDENSQIQSQVNAVAATSVRFEETIKTHNAPHSVEAKVRQFDNFNIENVKTLPCSLASTSTTASSSDDNNGSVLIDGNLFQRELHTMAIQIFRALVGNPYLASSSTHFQSQGFKVSNVITLPRSEHSYSDYFANRFKRVINLFIPLATRCTIVGKLVFDGNKLSVTAHPLVGFQLFFPSDNSASKHFLKNLAQQTIDRVQSLKASIPYVNFFRNSSLILAGTAGGIWICLFSYSYFFPSSKPPAAPPSLPPPPPPPPSSSSSASSSSPPTTVTPSIPDKESQAQGEKAQEGNEVEHSGPFDHHSCVICLSVPPTNVFIPCGHLCICNSCLVNFQRNARKCPICQSNYERVMPVYCP